jgi:hypothetical protein
MKTIIVVFGDANPKPNCTKQYCFRTSADLKPGDKLRSRDYDSEITVMDVLDKDYKYYHQISGDMSNERTSTYQWPIKTLEVCEKNNDVIYATIVK